MEQPHGHDPRENELAYTLTHLSEFWKKHGNTILFTILIVLVIWAGRNYYRYSTTQTHNTQWSDLSDASSPDAYQRVAEAAKDDTVKLLALLRSADLLLHEAATSNLDADTLSSNLNTASTQYQAIVDTPSAHPAFKLNAKLGLANIAEQQQDFAKAADLYSQVESQADPDYPAILAQAKSRREFLGRLDTPVVFSSEPEISITPTSDTIEATETIEISADDSPTDLIQPADEPAADQPTE